MSQPTAYAKQTNFVQYASNNTANPYPPASIDQEFDNLQTTLQQTLANIALLQRDDGLLQNGIVSIDALSEAVKTIIGSEGFNPRGAWDNGVAYSARDVVEFGTVTYVCVTSHVSNESFVTDLAADRWIALTSVTDAGDYIADAQGYANDAQASEEAAVVAQTAAEAALSDALAIYGSIVAVQAAQAAAEAAQAAAEAAQAAAETAQAAAETAETNAATAESNAASSASSASTSATTATTKASEASTSATNAASSATNAASSATAAAASETAAAASETAAAASKTAAETAETNAETAQAAAEAAVADAIALYGDATALSDAVTAAEAAQTAAETAETNAAASASTASSAAATATTKAGEASTSATNAAASATDAAASAASAASNATAAGASASAASGSESVTTAAKDAAEAAAVAAQEAQFFAENAKADAETAQASAEAAAAALNATSTSSVAIGTGAKSFTTQAGKQFYAGCFVMIVSDAAPSTDYMFGQVTSYVGSTLDVSVAVIGGSGTHTDWTIAISGARGANGTNGTDGTDGTDGAPVGFKYTGSGDEIPATPPTAGQVAFNTLFVHTATAIGISVTDADTNSIGAFLRTLDDSTNTVKGHLYLRNETDPTTWAVYSVSSINDNDTWIQVNVAHVDGPNISITGTETWRVFFVRTGDAGANGTPARNPGIPFTTSSSTDNTTVSAGFIESDSEFAPFTATNLTISLTDAEANDVSTILQQIDGGHFYVFGVPESARMHFIYSITGAPSLNASEDGLTFPVSYVAGSDEVGTFGGHSVSLMWLPPSGASGSFVEAGDAGTGSLAVGSTATAGDLSLVIGLFAEAGNGCMVAGNGAGADSPVANATILGNGAWADHDASTIVGTNGGDLGISGSMSIWNGQGDRVVFLSISSSTEDDTATTLTTDYSAASNNNQALVSQSPFGCCAIKGRVLAYDGTNNDVKLWSVEAAAKVVDGTASIVGTPAITVVAADSGASAWDVDLVIDDTNDAISVVVTGETGKSISWTVELAYMNK
jgi:hypothetical protein